MHLANATSYEERHATSLPKLILILLVFWTVPVLYSTIINTMQSLQNTESWSLSNTGERHNCLHKDNAELVSSIDEYLHFRLVP